MSLLIHPTFFPNVAHFVAMIQTRDLVFEVYDNYQKQTYRNRTSICGANGRMNLNVPVVYSQNNRQLYKDVAIFDENNWQSQHLKSLESAYRTSPFYEFYIDELMPLFTEKFTTIMALNLKCISVLYNCMQLPLTYRTTTEFNVIPAYRDGRLLSNCRKETPQSFQPYRQVFDHKYGFLSNLSILDLLFNEGPNTELYLNAQTLNI